MFTPGRQSNAQNPETIVSGELATIVGWLRRLPKEEIEELCEALAKHDAAHLAEFVARFHNPQDSA